MIVGVLSGLACGNVQFLPSGYLGKIFPTLQKLSAEVNLAANCDDSSGSYSPVWSRE